LDAAINDTNNDIQLLPWLRIVTCNGADCLNPDDTVPIEGLTDKWAVIESVDITEPTMKVLVEGDVSWNGGAGIKPLTVIFEYGDGAVLFTSYHTIGSSSLGFSPQERILQYLVFYLL
jgi:hypothetical protein